MFHRMVAKYVRSGHLQTDDSWTRTWRQAQILPKAAAATQQAASAAAKTCQSSTASRATTSAAGSDSGSASRPSGSGSAGEGQQQQAGGGKAAGASGGRGRGGGEGISSSQGGGGGLKLPKLLLLVGLPGSGKSTFADALVASGRGWKRICQDECGGSRRDTEAAFGIAALRGSDVGRHVILDR